MDAIPWYAWIAIVGIVALSITTLSATFAGSRKEERQALTAALQANTVAQEDSAARLEAIEQRLATIEKTLTDIP